MALPEGLTTWVWVATMSVAAPGLLGFGLVRWLGLTPAHGRAFALGVGYIVGHYVLAHVTLLWLWRGQPLPGWLLPIAAATTGAWLWRRATRRPPTAVAGPANTPAATWWSWLPVLVLTLLLLDTFTATGAQLVRYSDEAVNFAAKAKLLYCAPGFDLGAGLGGFVEHPDYPLFNPLTQVLTFASAGRVLHAENRLPVQFFAVALLGMLSAALHRRAHPLVATLVLVAFAGTSFASMAPTAYADVMLAAATLAAAESLLRWRETGERALLGLAGLAMGAMVATKNEGAMLVLALLGPFVVERVWWWWRLPKRSALWWPAAAWLLVPLSALLFQRAFNRHYGLQNDLVLFGRIADQLASHGPRLLDYYWGLLTDPALHRLLPLTFLVAAPIACLLRGREVVAGALLFASFLLAMGAYSLVFLGTVYDLQWHLDVAADRCVLHVLPLVASGLAAMTWPRRDPPAAR
ncbi:MAG: hypothetical protein K8J09_02840 [Planctomycetes bacterium]|nr:hypothetical protein [Planctomycetota bacterium]MCC7398938.1 hypothetical protein [Planctomycetota bacterium]